MARQLHHESQLPPPTQKMFFFSSCAATTTTTKKHDTMITTTILVFFKQIKHVCDYHMFCSNTKTHQRPPRTLLFHLPTRVSLFISLFSYSLPRHRCNINTPSISCIDASQSFVLLPTLPPASPSHPFPFSQLLIRTPTIPT